MENQHLSRSELVLTPDNSIYHLHLQPGQIADTIFLVGDPGRVATMSSLFDSIEFKVENREFVTHTGVYRGKRVSVLSTGIGTDNIDIVINELDALANIEFTTREVLKNRRSLTLVRIGTSGALHADLDPGSVIVSDVSCGLDNLMHYYKELPAVSDDQIRDHFKAHMDWNPSNSDPYFVFADPSLVSLFKGEMYHHGITISAPGFYAPQGRTLRMEIADKEFIEKICNFNYGSFRINNFEMEGSALAGLSAILGHRAMTICIALANRKTGKFITDYQPLIKNLLLDVLDKILFNDD